MVASLVVAHLVVRLVVGFSGGPSGGGFSGGPSGGGTLAAPLVGHLVGHLVAPGGGDGARGRGGSSESEEFVDESVRVCDFASPIIELVISPASVSVLEQVVDTMDRMLWVFDSRLQACWLNTTNSSATVMSDTTLRAASFVKLSIGSKAMKSDPMYNRTS